MNVTEDEIGSQPEIWRRAIGSADLVADVRSALAAPGESVLAIGCGTSWFVAQSYAALRERAGLGETDARCASEPAGLRRYDRVVAFCRSGTTTEVLDALAAVPAGTRRVTITAVEASPAEAVSDETLVLAFADERSVVQTRFPTTVLALARAALGERRRTCRKRRGLPSTGSSPPIRPMSTTSCSSATAGRSGSRMKPR